MICFFLGCCQEERFLAFGGKNRFIWCVPNYDYYWDLEGRNIVTYYNISSQFFFNILIRDPPSNFYLLTYCWHDWQLEFKICHLVILLHFQICRVTREHLPVWHFIESSTSIIYCRRHSPFLNKFPIFCSLRPEKGQS